ncbi:MAG: hypothetical protein ACQEVA_01820 [Myxococcota bacterium]
MLSANSSCRGFFVFLMACLLLVAGACTGDDENNGGSNNTADVVDDVDAGDGDVEDDVNDADDTDDSDADASSTGLCSSCSADEDCGGAEDRCVTLPAGDSACARACDDQNPCPDSYFCANVGTEESPDTQCVPEELTCVDRCSDVTCDGDQICDPWTGDCTQPLGTCDAPCQNNSVCGDGPEDICININQNERVCTAGCDPQSDATECPTNFFCTPLGDDPDTNEGVCYPIDQTCTDQCAGVDCQDGFNCNQTTGQCEQAQYGYCESGCESDAQCGRDSDRCLNLGIGDGSHCWQDCTDNSEGCAAGYECQRLQRTTFSICIPVGQSCDLCEDTDCFPGGVCDPSTGECVERPADCTVAGCEDGQLCDPVSTQCVEVGRACSGDSWATDCDNVVTSCTTRRSGTSGFCAALCSGDGDCDAGTTCQETTLQTKLCLADDFGGAQACGTMASTASPVGQPCGSGASSCDSGADICVQDGNLEGFCSRECTGDSDCDAGQSCATGPDGRDLCIPTQCECAIAPALGADLAAGFDTALGNVEVSICDLGVEPSTAAMLTELSNTKVDSTRITEILRHPMRGIAQMTEILADIDASSDSPSAAVESAASAAGLNVTGTAGSYSFSGTESKLTQAVSQFITAAGGTPDTSALETEAADVPSEFQDVAAPIIASAAEALTARNDALQGAGWSDSDRDDFYENAPYLFLPGTSAQEASAPDLTNALVETRVREFPLTDMATAAANLAATIESVQGDTSNAANWTGFSYVVDTPAGKIVLGDAGNTTYDPTADSTLDGDIAVLIDAGGDDVYKLPAGANNSGANGVSLLLDVSGSDEYSYVEVADANDNSSILPSDADGRAAGGDLTQEDGPVSLSATGRQGAARMGVAMLVDWGTAVDTYESLRMSQGSAMLGVGLLFDSGGDDTYTAEAFSQGASLKGLGVLWDADGTDNYKVWHAGQGFGTASGLGLLRDVAGGDSYEAVKGSPQGPDVLYFSLADRAASNRNLAQGASAGVAATASAPGLAGGMGLLSDAAGVDTYAAGTFAQGFGSVRGVGVLHDIEGADSYDARGSVQGAGTNYGAGLLVDAAGDDIYNAATSRVRQNGQGSGNAYGWGVFWDAAGDDEVTYSTPGGGIGRDGGYGFVFNDGGADTHTSAAEAGWGFAVNDASSGSPLEDALTIGVFLDAGSDTDTYDRPNVGQSSIGNDSTWLQPDVSTFAAERGSGVDE